MRIRSAPLVDGLHELVLVVQRIHGDSQSVLTQVGGALDNPRLLLGPAERGEQQHRQNRNDGDNDQQFDQCKCLAALRFHDNAVRLFDEDIIADVEEVVNPFRVGGAMATV